MLKEKFESFTGEAKNMQHYISQYKGKINKLEGEKEELQKGCEALCSEIKEIANAKQQAVLRVEKVHLEMKE